MVRCKDLPDSDRGDFRCRGAGDSSSCAYCFGNPGFIGNNYFSGNCISEKVDKCINIFLQPILCVKYYIRLSFCRC